MNAGKQSQKQRLSNVLIIRCQQVLPVAIGQGATKNRLTASEYIRRSVLAQLQKDGIDPSQLAGAA